MNDKTKKMPLYFFGHGSPMNAIEDNHFTQSLTRMGKNMEVPKGILMISAHWQSRGTWVTGMQKPKTIHDFYGFPKALFDVQYPASGEPEMAKRIISQIENEKVKLDDQEWGLDHGTWAILKHIFPKANIPVVQLSLDINKSLREHFELAKELKFLREQGVIIMGSGNIVHNLKEMNRKMMIKPHDWAIEFDEWTKRMLIDGNYGALVDNPLESKAGKLSIPTLEHYIPLLYVLGAADQSDQLSFDFEEIHNASLSMRCFHLSRF